MILADICGDCGRSNDGGMISIMEAEVLILFMK